MIYRNMMNFDGKNVLITGGTGSIGSEFARAFASCGANIMITDISDKNAISILNEFKKYGVKAYFEKCNLLNIKDIRIMVSNSISVLGSIDILCNHAGYNIRKPAVSYTEDEWDQLIGVDLKAIFFVAVEVAKYMILEGKGKIINTASVSAARGHKNLSIYASAKGGIRQLTKVLAHEWAEYGINVNAIGPGYVRTSQTKDYLDQIDVKKNLLARVPMNRFGEVSDIASVALFLASEGASYITGQTLFVEGGRLID